MTKQEAQRKLTRRAFLKSTALTAGAMAAAGAVGCTSVDTEGGAAQDAPVEEKTYINTCRGNCGSNCLLNVKVREGKVVSTMPITFPKEYEGVTQGCVKGLANPVRIYGAHRLIHPLRQMGERGSDNWEQISWDEAISLIAEKFQAAIDEYGGRSIGIWVGSGNTNGYVNGVPCWIDNNNPYVGTCPPLDRFIKKAGATLLGNSGDMAGLYMKWYVLGYPMPMAEDYAHAKTIFIWGSNPAEAGMCRSRWHYICKAKENGAKIVAIDPLFTTSAAHADKWVPIRVGTDAALMCAMINYLIDNGKANMEYLKSGSVAPLLVKEDGKYLRLSDLGVEIAEGEVDEPVVWDEDVAEFVAHNAAANPALSAVEGPEGISVRTTYDISVESIKPFDVAYASKECGIPEETIIELAELAVADSPTFLACEWGLEHTYNSFRLYYCLALLASVVGHVGMLGGGYDAPLNSASSIVKAPPALDQSATSFEGDYPIVAMTGEDLISIMETGKWVGQDWPVRCLYTQSVNALDNGQAPSAMIEAWNKIGFVVVAEQFMTTSAHYADLVLPVSMSFESEDFLTGRNFMCQKAIEPLGESKTDFEIWCAIVEKMGLEGLDIKTGEEYLRSLLDTPENIEAGLGYDFYHENGVALGDYVYGEKAAVEYNALGRTQFYMENILPRDPNGFVFEIGDRIPSYTQPYEARWDNPLREKYPLFGFFNHENYHGQSLHAHNAWLDEFRTVDGKPFCRIHEKAAAERGIKTGDAVKVYNDYGFVLLNALVTKGIQEESINLPHGFFWDEFDAGFAQSLTGPHLDPQTTNANINDFLCQVEKYEGGAE